MIKIFSFLALLIGIANCSTNEPNFSESKGRKDVQSISKNDDQQTYTIKCKDGRVYADATIDDVNNPSICSSKIECEGNWDFINPEPPRRDGILCTHIMGNVQVSQTDDLEFLSNIKYIGGYLKLIEIKQLKGIENLREVSGNFELIGSEVINFENLTQELLVGGLDILNNDNLESVSNLTTSRKISKFQIRGNEKLTRIGSYDRAESIEKLQIRFNPKLGEVPLFKGLVNCELIDISYNRSLTTFLHPKTLDVPFEALRQVKDILIVRNDSLKLVRGFLSLQTVDRIMLIDLPMLENLGGFDRLESLNSFFLVGTSLKTHSGFKQIHKMGGRLVIRDNKHLESLEVGSIRESKNVTVEQNPKLQSIEFLKGMEAISEEITISENAILTGIDELKALKTVGSVYISRNANLTPEIVLKFVNAENKSLASITRGRFRVE